MNNTFLALVILLIGLGAMLWWGKQNAAAPSASATGGAGSFTATSTFYDFGTISMKDGLAKTTFTITNPSDTDATLMTVVTSCMCTTAYIKANAYIKGPFGMVGHGGPASPVREIVEAGASRRIEVVYDPNAHGPAGVGQINRFVYLGDSKGRVLTLEIKALVKP